MPTAQGKRPPLLRPSALKPAGYRARLTDIRTRIRAARIKASLSVNRELICLYWDIGGLIVNRQRTEGWGKSVVEDLASDVQKGVNRGVFAAQYLAHASFPSGLGRAIGRRRPRWAR